MGTINVNNYDLHKFPIYTTADIAENTPLIAAPSTSAETSYGCLIAITATDYVNWIAMTTANWDYSVDGSCAVNGTSWKKIQANLDPSLAVRRFMYKQSATMVLASDMSSTTVTITNLENDIDTSWLYCTGGTGKGQNRFVITSTAGSCTVKTTGNPVWKTGDTCIKILRCFHELVKFSINSPGGLMIDTAAAAGSGTLKVLDNSIVRGGSFEEFLDPTKHELDGLDTQNVQFWMYCIAPKSYGNTIAS